jgi:hypothetical protein
MSLFLVNSEHPSFTLFTQIPNDEMVPQNESNDEDKQEKKAESSPQIVNIFENTVRSVSGNTDYKFGDLSKKAMSELTGKDLEKESYQFGDITKNVVTRTGKVVSGKDDYQFGDISKSLLKDVDSTLRDWTGRQLNNLPLTLYQEFMTKFTPPQRQILIVSTIRFLAIALLTWGFWSNLCTSFAVTVSWLRANWVLAAPTVPSNPKGFIGTYCKMVWANNSSLFFRSYTSLRILMDPLFLVIQGAGTIFTVLGYERHVGRIENDWISKWILNEYPLLGRALALVLSFAWNVGVSFLITSAGIGFGSTVGYYKWR